MENEYENYKIKNEFTKEKALKEFDELKNIALNCYDKQGNPNIQAAIRALEKTEQVRLKPAVIFGSNDINGCIQSIFEILSNSIDEAREGYGDNIELTIHKDNSITVKDHGRGVPMAMNRKEGKYNFELVFDHLYAGGKYNSKDYTYSLGTNGLGATATNYASQWFKVESIRDGKKYCDSPSNLSDCPKWTGLSNTTTTCITSSSCYTE